MDYTLRPTKKIRTNEERMAREGSKQYHKPTRYLDPNLILYKTKEEFSLNNYIKV